MATVKSMKADVFLGFTLDQGEEWKTITFKMSALKLLAAANLHLLIHSVDNSMENMHTVVGCKGLN